MPRSYKGNMASTTTVQLVIAHLPPVSLFTFMCLHGRCYCFVYNVYCVTPYIWDHKYSTFLKQGETLCPEAIKETWLQQQQYKLL